MTQEGCCTFGQPKADDFKCELCRDYRSTLYAECYEVFYTEKASLEALTPPEVVGCTWS